MAQRKTFPASRALHFGRLFAVLSLSLALVGCASLQPRDPVPEAQLESASVLSDMGPAADLRIWGDERAPIYDYIGTANEAQLKASLPAFYGRSHAYLALSGGGENGAFGAGILSGWTQTGTRPEFAIVTGVSTGALIAPFAFLGSGYDRYLEEIYTKYSQDDLVRRQSIFAILSGGAAAIDPAPMRELIARYMNPGIIAAIAEQHRRGRQLWIGTTNLDAGRPVLWNIGAIANSSDPNKHKLIHDVLLASASIPGAFPPVLINVDANGRRYDELHVDGGTTNQVFLYPPGTDWRGVIKKLRVKGTPQLYVIRNASLNPTYKPVQAKILPIAGRSISSLIRTQGLGDLYRIYMGAQKDGIDFNLAFIPQGEDSPKHETKKIEVFDLTHMRRLFQLGQQMGRDGKSWHKAPPAI